MTSEWRPEGWEESSPFDHFEGVGAELSTLIETRPVDWALVNKGG